jgi:molecular chaperone HtpG
MTTTTEPVKETRAFQAEVKQLLQLMIHSLYGNKEIFLRELISNASDAADKLRFEALNRPDLFENDSDLAIEVSFDKAARTITIADNGIGMSRAEAIEHLGTIAKSGTREFFSKLSGDQQKDAALIGQFGVGFYSSFIVADKVTVESRRAGLSPAQGVRWESDGSGEFSVEDIDRPKRGTSITLHLRADEDDFLSSFRLKSVLKKYSDHISLPIHMKQEEWDKEKSEYVTKDEVETVNQASALWTRPKSEITDEQYREFYKHVSHDFNDPLAWTHSKVEGRSEYTQLLYLPKDAPFDLWDRERRAGIKLYVKRVFIMDDAEQLMPVYLRFVKGVIDSNDLPLNVSREILQESRDVKAIREGSTKKVLGMIEDLATNRPDDFRQFWKTFGQVLKEGLGEDHANSERIAKLVRFASTHDDREDETVSLADYVARMKEGQDKIYYVTGESYTAAKNSPHLEIFRKKGVEVLVMSDRVDEWALNFLHEFDGKELVSVAKGGLDLGKLEDESEKAEHDKETGEMADVVAKMKTALGDAVKDVRVTFRLTDSPSCLVADDGAMSANLARMLKAAGQKAPESKPILEINPHHALVAKLKEAGDGQFGDLTQVLFDQATLAEGGQLENPAAFVRRINALLTTGA